VARRAYVSTCSPKRSDTIAEFGWKTGVAGLARYNSRPADELRLPPTFVEIGISTEDTISGCAHPRIESQLGFSRPFAEVLERQVFTASDDRVEQHADAPLHRPPLLVVELRQSGHQGLFPTDCPPTRPVAQGLDQPSPQSPPNWAGIQTQERVQFGWVHWVERRLEDQPNERARPGRRAGHARPGEPVPV
jgi:hypothetical protein